MRRHRGLAIVQVHRNPLTSGVNSSQRVRLLKTRRGKKNSSPLSVLDQPGVNITTSVSLSSTARLYFCKLIFMDLTYCGHSSLADLREAWPWLCRADQTDVMEMCPLTIFHCVV
ncbi:hypothetical protein RRG08_052367 [Elysia crispata]|uniref:Uncharacterized protein n=1 Tax=Elysia crispata TaxID=231223 RepID=A0AAE1A6Z7_9GAST|nr:hypothetical protein RRG08_052367 [Elysia crispata]